MPHKLSQPASLPIITLRALNGLHEAIAAGSVDEVEDWLTTDLPLDLPVGGQTPLTRAVQHGHAALLPLLVARMQAMGLPLDEEVHVTSAHDRSTTEVVPRPLTIALQHQQWAVLRRLLELGADPNAPMVHGLPTLPLLRAVQENQGEAIDLLLEFFADPNLADGWQKTPLHQAALKAQGDVIRRLLVSGGDPSLAQAPTGNTPLHVLMENWRDTHSGDASTDHLDSLQTLMQHGANPWLRNRAGQSVWDVAPVSALPVLTRAWAEQEKTTLRNAFASTPFMAERKILRL